MTSDTFPTFKAIGRKIRASGRKIRASGPKLRRVARLSIKITLITLLVLVVIGFVGYYSAIFFGKRSLEHKLSELRAHGAELDILKLAPKPVPDAENAAPLYLKAYDALHGKDIQLSYSESPVSLSFAIDHSACVPYDPSPNKEAAKLDAKRIVAKSAPAFPLIEQALKCKQCRFNVDWTDFDHYHFDYLRKLGTLSSLMALRVEIHLDNNDVNAALHDVETILVIARSVHQEPSIASFRMQSEGIRKAVKALERVVHAESLTEAKANQIYDLLNEFTPEEDFHSALIGQRAIDNAFCESERNEPGGLGMILFDWAECGTGTLDKCLWEIADRSPVSLKRMWEPFSYKDQVLMLNTWDKYIASSKMPYRKLIKKYPPNGSLQLPAYTILAQVTTGGVGWEWVKRDATLAQVNIAKAALALEAYRSRYNRYPNTLGSLKAYPDWDFGRDPFSGGELKYKRQENGFILYSIGPDLKDNHGSWYPGLDGWEHKVGDIVWIN